jgi:hypothetical protein
MSYTTSSQETTQTSKNHKTAIIYSLLIAALAITWGYIIYDKSKHQEEVQQLQSQVSTSDTKREAIQHDFEIASAKIDSLNTKNIKLQGDFAQKNAEAQKLKSNIASILKKKNASDSDLAQAKTMIDELNGKITELYAQVEELKNKNADLTASNTQLTEEKTGLQQNLQTVTTQKDSIESVASTLHASNIHITPIDIRNNGKEKATTTAKRADIMRVSFNLDENRITPSGTKDLYVVVTDPSGNVMSKGETLNTRDDGEKKYTEKVMVNYEQGKPTTVSFDWKQDENKYDVGNYMVSIYNNGFKIGEGNVALKKGGLFASK